MLPKRVLCCSMHKFLFSIFVLVFLVSQASAENLCAIAKSAVSHASEIRGLKAKHSIPCLVHDKQEVKEYLLHTIQTKLPPNKLKMEEVVYKVLGILPGSFDYEDGIVDLYLSQIGGYYDPEADHFVMAGWMPALLQTTVAVHELTHGLQDQHFNLEKLVDPKIENSDLLLARSALVEGDATAVMFDYARELAGQPSLAQEENVNSMMMHNILGVSLVAAGMKVPQSLQMILIFPYTSGLRFAHALLRENGYKSIDKAFKSPPRSTEEILHPEKYGIQPPDFMVFQDEETRVSAIPVEAEREYVDTVGEFSISALLANYATDKKASTEAAAGWGGDRVAVYRKGATRWVVWLTNWDTERDAQEFLRAFRASLATRFPAASVGVLSKSLTSLGQDSQLSTRSQGKQVHFVWTQTGVAE